MTSKNRQDILDLLADADKYHRFSELNQDDIPRADVSEDNCQLCDRYLTTHTPACIGCPIFASTGQTLCAGTPHGDLKDAQLSLDYCTSGKPYATVAKWKRACIRMAKFLEDTALGLCDDKCVDNCVFRFNRLTTLRKLMSNEAAPKKPAPVKLPGRVNTGVSAFKSNRPKNLGDVPVGSICTHKSSVSIIIKTGELELTFFGPNRVEGTSTTYQSREAMTFQLGAVHVVGSIKGL